MNPDAAVNDLLDFSTDIRGVALLDAAGDVAVAAPRAASAGLAAAAAQLWSAAESCAAGLSSSPLEYVVVRDDPGAVAMLHEGERRIVAVTGPSPAVGLLLFDLRTCLNDAYPQEGDR